MVMVWRAIRCSLFIAIFTISFGFFVQDSFAGDTLAANCRGGEIPCTKQCGPSIIKSYSAGGVNYVVMAESAEVNLLAGKSTLFDASCQPGFIALGGGYKIIEDGTTINLDEIKINGNWSAVDANTGLSGWNVWIYRDKDGDPDNCLNVEVHSVCIQAQ